MQRQKADFDIPWTTSHRITRTTDIIPARVQRRSVSLICATLQGASVSRASAFSQTLPSPLRMSPTPYDGSPPYQSQTFPTPPSTAGFSSHMPMQDMNNSSATLDQNTMMDQSQGDTPMTDAPDYRRSDHERQPSPPYKSSSVAMPLLCQKRKIPVPSRCIAQCLG